MANTLSCPCFRCTKGQYAMSSCEGCDEWLRYCKQVPVPTRTSPCDGCHQRLYGGPTDCPEHRRWIQVYAHTDIREAKFPTPIEMRIRAAKTSYPRSLRHYCEEYFKHSTGKEQKGIELFGIVTDEYMKVPVPPVYSDEAINRAVTALESSEYVVCVRPSGDPMAPTAKCLYICWDIQVKDARDAKIKEE